MNAPEHRKQNRRLGLILGLLFVGLFAIVTAAIVTGIKAPQAVEGTVNSLIVPVLGIIGLLLISAAVGEIIQNRRLAVILALLLIGLVILGPIVHLNILRGILVLLVIAAVAEIIVPIIRKRLRNGI